MSYILPRGHEKCNKNLKKLRPVYKQSGTNGRNPKQSLGFPLIDRAMRRADRLSNAAKAAFDVLYLYFLRSEIISILEELVTSVLAYECKSVKP